MIRVLVYLIIVGFLAYGVTLLADRPGDVAITWQGLRIETSLMVLSAAIVALVAALVLIWSLIRAILRSPTTLANLRRHRRGVHAYEAISNGLIAVGAGDVGAARKFAAEVKRLAPSEPLALLLNAQSAQLSGDREGAEQVFRTMAGRADTKPLGLHGLFIEAQRRGDGVAARAYAEEAARTAPVLGWAGRAVLEARCAAGDWAGALALLDNHKSAIDPASYRRQRAVLLTARAQAAEETDRDSAKALALEAVKLAPALVPAAALAGRLLAESGELRKASRILNKAWLADPHPDLARAVAALRYGDAARDRLKRIEGLAGMASQNVESALALARAAIDAQQFAKARTALEPYLAAPTKRICLLMAEIERAERNDEGRAREWLARALNAASDPAWTADGYVSDRWLPVSPVSGRLDAFEWRVPLTGMVSAAPVIEPEAAPVVPASAKPDEPRAKDETPKPPAEAEALPAPAPPQPLVPKTEPVIPLVHAPDDPGPDNGDDSDRQNRSWPKTY